MEREYVRGNKGHWKEIYEWAYGKKPKEDYDAEGSCFVSDTCIILKQGKNDPFFIDAESDYDMDKVLYDVVTTNPNLHEVKPWEIKPYYDPKPFDKVIGWNDNEHAVWPDIFLYKAFDTYSCAKGCFMHVKPYNEEEYLKSLEKSTDEEL